MLGENPAGVAIRGAGLIGVVGSSADPAGSSRLPQLARALRLAKVEYRDAIRDDGH